MPRNESILILGGGIYQVPLIERAKARGYRAVVASIPGDYPGIPMADMFLEVNTTDEDAIVAAAWELHAAAVLTTGTDIASCSIGAANDALGLAGPTRAMAAKATNKYDMKVAFAAAGVRTAAFKKASTLDEAYAAWDYLQGDCKNGAQGSANASTSNPHPVIVKCPDRSGSRGITKVDGKGELEAALANAIDASICKFAVIEDFIIGHEIGIDGYVGPDGKVAFIAYHDKRVRSNGLTNVPVGHFMNEELVAHYANDTDCLAQCNLLAQAVGMRNCFFNVDALIDAENKCWIIETGVRVGATCIPEVISAYYGFDLYEAMLDAALGLEPKFSMSPVIGAAEGRILLSDKAGVAKEVDTAVVFDGLVVSGSVALSASVDYKPGEETLAFVNGTSRLGQILCTGTSPDEVAAALDKAEAALLEAYVA